jgi:DNA-binding NarL/FixJ family response regulator
MDVLKILVVEDQYLARLALHSVIDCRSDMKIVAETGTGAEALPLFRKHHPDITIMDIRLPGKNGLDAIRAIRAENPEARIIVLSNYDGAEDVHRALTAGAMSYLTKDADAADVISAIQSVQRGRSFMPAALRGLLATRLGADAMTPRELSVLESLAQGLTNQQIADLLGIAEKTVRIHMTHIFDKLGVTDRTQAVIVAVQRGIVHIE